MLAPGAPHPSPTFTEEQVVALTTGVGGTSALRIDRRDVPLRRLRDGVAGDYRVHPSVLGMLSAQTLVWMAGFRWGTSDRLRAYRVP